MMGNRMAGKAVIVTGAGSIGPGWGNGKAAAVLYAREGAGVLAMDRNGDAAAETAAIIAEAGGRALAMTGDVTDAADVAAMAKACLDAFGAIDVLHNNVGILRVGGPVEQTLEDWTLVNDVNVTSAFLTCKTVLPTMVEQGRGAIVNIASVAGISWLGVPYISYSTSKAAMIQLTRMIAVEYAARGVRCNAVLPGFMRTPMVEASLAGAYAGGDADAMFEMRDRQCPMGHMGDAWDVAHAALYLASDEAKYVTGAELVVDGGLTLRCVT
jgi:NAD(P)-dependent dehydrogenase (short-subunit alcohol dehydrogenase family)